MNNDLKFGVKNKYWMYRGFLQEMNYKLIQFINKELPKLELSDQNEEDRSFESRYPFITKESIENVIGYPIQKYEVIPVYDKDNELIEYSINVQPVKVADFITIKFNASDEDKEDMDL